MPVPSYALKSPQMATAQIYMEIQILVACCDPCISQILVETSRGTLQGRFKVMAILHHSAEWILRVFMKF